jgi:hypothetical protein
MKKPLTPHLRSLLATRDTVAAAAAEAEAHDLLTAANLCARQAELEDQLEQQLPTQEWRRLYPHWVIQDAARGHDAYSPAPEHCRICAAARQSPVHQSA